MQKATFPNRCHEAQGSNVAVDIVSLRSVMGIISLQMKAKKFSFIFPDF